MYNIYTMLGRRCINVIQMFCVCWDIYALLQTVLKLVVSERCFIGRKQRHSPNNKIIPSVANIATTTYTERNQAIFTHTSSPNHDHNFF